MQYLRLLVVALAAGFLAAAPARGADQTTPLSSFETDQDENIAFAGGTIVEEHATDGKKALKLVSDKEKYAKIEVPSARMAEKFAAHDKLLVDVFNPQDKDVEFDVKILDSKGEAGKNKTWFMSTVSAKPGQSTVAIDLTSLVREGSRKSDTPEKLNVADVKRFVLSIAPRPDQVTVFMDNVRLSKPAGQAPATGPASAPGAVPAKADRSAPPVSPAVNLDPNALRGG